MGAEVNLGMGNSQASRSGIWDCHVHCYPDSVIEDPSGWAREHSEPHWEHLVTSGPQGWAGPEELIRAMDRDGVEKVLLQGWYWEQPATAELQNRWHAEWVSQFPERFMACAAIHPAMPDPVAELERARSWGACGVGECLAQVQSPEGWAHPAWEDILKWTTAAGWLMGIHVTEPVGHTYPGRIETPLHELVDLFEQHPDQKWLCAHWGGGLPFHALNRRVKKALHNVWFDSAAGPLLYDAQIWRMVNDLVGPEKIIFGSDFPLILYPRVENRPGWARLLCEFEESGLSDQARQSIGRENLIRLLGRG